MDHHQVNYEQLCLAAVKELDQPQGSSPLCVRKHILASQGLHVPRQIIELTLGSAAVAGKLDQAERSGVSYYKLGLDSNGEEGQDDRSRRRSRSPRVQPERGELMESCVSKRPERTGRRRRTVEHAEELGKSEIGDTNARGKRRRTLECSDEPVHGATEQPVKDRVKLCNKKELGALQRSESIVEPMAYCDIGKPKASPAKP